MENKQILKILENLNLIREGSNDMEVNRLEILVNSNSKIRIIGGEFLELQQMEIDGLVESDLRNWYYDITKKGVEYLEKNSKK